MKRLFLFLTIALGFVAQSKAGDIDTLWTIGKDGTLGSIVSIALSPSEDTIAAGYRNGSIKFFNSTNGDSLYCFKHGGHIESISISSDGKYLASGGNGRAVKIWDLRSKKLITSLIDTIMNADSGVVRTVQFTPDGKLHVLYEKQYFTLHESSWLYTFHNGDWTIEKKTNIPLMSPEMKISPDLKSVAIRGGLWRENKTAIDIYLYDYNADTLKYDMFPQESKYVGNFVFSKNGQSLALSFGKGLGLYSTINYKSYFSYNIDSVYIFNTTFFNDGKRMIINQEPPIGLNFFDIETNSSFGFVQRYLPDYSRYWIPSIIALNKDNNKLFCAGVILTCYDITNFNGIEKTLAVQPTLYPNPSTGSVIIPLNETSIISVTVASISGEYYDCAYSTNTDSITVDLTALPHGSYMITIKSSNTLTSYKVVKE